MKTEQEIREKMKEIIEDDSNDWGIIYYDALHWVLDEGAQK
jgi:hypothetical protein